MRTLGGAVTILLATVLLHARVDAQSVHPLKYLSKQCNEDAVALHLDPGPFEEIVGPEFSLALEDGKARVVIVVQDCSQYWIDGEDLGPAQDVQVWVSIRGPTDVRPVVGAEQTMATRTWLALFVGSSNPRVREAKGTAGTAVAPIHGLVLDPPGPERGGRFHLTRKVDYSWHVSTPAAAPVRLVGLNHDVYVRELGGHIVLNRIQAIVHVSAGPSEGTFTVAGATEALRAITPGTYTASVATYFPMWSRATLGLPPHR